MERDGARSLEKSVDLRSGLINDSEIVRNSKTGFYVLAAGVGLAFAGAVAAAIYYMPKLVDAFYRGN